MTDAKTQTYYLKKTVKGLKISNSKCHISIKIHKKDNLGRPPTNSVDCHTSNLAIFGLPHLTNNK